MIHFFTQYKDLKIDRTEVQAQVSSSSSTKQDVDKNFIFFVNFKRVVAQRKTLRLCTSAFNYFASIAIILLIVTACQTQETNTTATVESTPTSPVAPPATSNSLSPIVEAIQQEQPLTAYIKKKMTEQLWHYETAIVIKQPEKSKAYVGKWVKFNPDNTLLSGYFGEEGDIGRWVYDEANDILTVVEGGERPSYSQWNVKFSSNTDDVVIWVGTSKFQNNNTQIKMLRKAEKPVRK